jgi:DNA-binding CsgD family transcriptional regulator
MDWKNFGEIMDNLSKREKDVIRLLLLGKSNKQIAHELEIAERTVEFHMNNIFKKIGAGSRVELVLKLGKSTADFANKPVESTVAADGQIAQNGKKANTSNPVQEFSDEKTSESYEELAMTRRLESILPVVVTLLGIALAIFGVIMHEFGAVVIGICSIGMAVYHWVMTGKKKRTH